MTPVATPPKFDTKSFDALRSTYSLKPQNVSVLSFGLYGSGKTALLRTARKPVLLFLFDPGGAVPLQKEINEGSVIIMDYTNENSKTPTEFSRFEKDFDRFSRDGTFNNVGTIALDSFTTWFDAMMNQTVKTLQRKNGIPEIQDWQVLKNVVTNYIKLFSSFAADFYMTAHLVNDKDDITGEILSDVNAFKSLRPLMPIYFTEKWYLETRKKGTSFEYVINLESTGRYKASSRLKGLNDKILSVMPADIKEIFRLAGQHTEDLPY